MSLEQALTLVQDRTRVVDCHRLPIGLLTQIYLDVDASVLLWAAVVFDAPSRHETAVPVHDAHVDGTDLIVSYPSRLIACGPRICADDYLTPLEQERLRHHYQHHMGGSVDLTQHRRPGAATSGA